VMGDENGQLAALSGATGQMMAGFPITLGAEVRGTPALCDCSGAGTSEIVLSDWDTNLYMWDYGFPFNPNGPPAGPQVHHDAMRTGFSKTTTLLATPETPRLPRVLAFAPPSPNPLIDRAHLTWEIPVGYEGETFDLSLYDIAGRRVITVANGPVHAGRFSA